MKLERKKLRKYYIRFIEYYIYFVAIVFIGMGLLRFMVSSMENNDVTYIYQFIGYSLTMAGFTLLGGIFEKKKHQDIEIKLFESSKFFILAALLFMSGMALVAIGGYTAVKYINPWYFTTLAAISLIIGQIIFVIGFLHLVRYLMMYRPTQDKL